MYICIYIYIYIYISEGTRNQYIIYYTPARASYSHLLRARLYSFCCARDSFIYLLIVHPDRIADVFSKNLSSPEPEDPF